jgi:RHS repeat-associated protein
MRVATTIRRGPVQRAVRRPPGRLDSHRSWTDRRGWVKTVNSTTRHFTWDQVTGATPLLLSDGTNGYIYGPNDLPIEQVYIGGIHLVGTGKATDLGTAGSLTVTFPATQAGDEILLAATDLSPNDPASTPSGYMQVKSDSSSTGTTRVTIYARTASAGETQATVAFTSTPVTAPKTLIALVYRGADPNHPIDTATAAGATSATTTTVSLPSVTTSSSGDQIVAIAGETTNPLAPTWTLPTSMTAQAQADATTLASSVAADRHQSAAGATGSMTFTSSSLIGSVGAVEIALRPIQTVYVQHDQQGSTRLLTDGTAAVVGTYSYTPYGVVKAHSSGISTPLRFDGQYQDDESQFYYLRARYYDAATGGFMTPDPMRPQTRAPYAYSAGDPLDLADPSGMISVGVCGGFNLAFEFAGVSVTDCLTRIVSGGPDEIGVTGTPGAGGAGGADVSIGAYYQVSNATNLSDLRGKFDFVTVGGEYLGGASATVFWGRNSANKLIYGIEFGPAFGVGIRVGVGQSYTFVDQLGGWKARLARYAWGAVNPTLDLASILRHACREIEHVVG